MCKVSRLDIAVCFSLGLERFPYFCPRPSVILGFRVHIFLVIWLCFCVLHSLRLQTLREQLLAVFLLALFRAFAWRLVAGDGCPSDPLGRLGISGKILFALLLLQSSLRLS